MLCICLLQSVKQFNLSPAKKLDHKKILLLSKVTTIFCFDIYFKSLKAFLSGEVNKQCFVEICRVLKWRFVSSWQSWLQG